MEKEQHIAIVGAGVIGLSTALLLVEKGYQVTIHTKELPFTTTSAIAAAVWFPYQAQPYILVNKWSKFTYYKLKELSLEPKTGVHFSKFTIIDQKKSGLPWLDAFPKDQHNSAKQFDINNIPSLSYERDVPVMESPIYLNYLYEKFLALGGQMVLEEVQDLKELSFKYDWIVNCSGLGALRLAEDAKVFPIQGQIVKMKPNSTINGVLCEFPIDEFKDETTYIIPREDCIVLGGTVRKDQFDLTPDTSTTQRILQRSASFNSKIKTEDIIDVVVGLRPGRDSIRVEKEDGTSIIHNYGHGGSGFTVSWGCAAHVADLISYWSEHSDQKLVQRKTLDI
ncbi:FAD-dependent oxidoreductase [Sediminitomix flava]|uniref:D-amino-acid oxidase n=1 Tax=Sediminitomix flava TaxID=379075 RepID=A0A315ZIL6_SEDFL|nr:FAD-dependent oxidoreductase [Sediminitomix flava]PWJ44940.1 D-amino-acid:oxygen oxidoreductase (deaminating) [Sediminitomix flava]